MALDWKTKRLIAEGKLPLKGDTWEFMRKADYYESVIWNDLRVKAVTRDNNTCRDCGVSGSEYVMNVHHSSYPDKIYRNGLEYIDILGDKVSNLVTLCINCHRGRHDRIPLPQDKVLVKGGREIYYIYPNEEVQPLDVSGLTFPEEAVEEGDGSASSDDD